MSLSQFLATQSRIIANGVAALAADNNRRDQHPQVRLGRMITDMQGAVDGSAEAGRVVGRRGADDPYIAPRAHLPMALMARLCREAAPAIVSANDRDRARADFIEAMTRTLDNAIGDERRNGDA